MELEYGRKVLTHLFKRNNYHTMVVGKPQPVEAAISTNNPEKTDYYFIEGNELLIIKNSVATNIGLFPNSVSIKNFTSILVEFKNSQANLSLFT